MIDFYDLDILCKIGVAGGVLFWVLLVIGIVYMAGKFIVGV
jgi:hypothetical protein